MKFNIIIIFILSGDWQGKEKPENLIFLVSFFFLVVAIL